MGYNVLHLHMCHSHRVARHIYYVTKRNFYILVILYFTIWCTFFRCDYCLKNNNRTAVERNNLLFSATATTVGIKQNVLIY